VKKVDVELGRYALPSHAEAFCPLCQLSARKSPFSVGQVAEYSSQEVALVIFAPLWESFQNNPLKMLADFLACIRVRRQIQSFRFLEQEIKSNFVLSIKN
jgi:hypothetical protein